MTIKERPKAERLSEQQIHNLVTAGKPYRFKKGDARTKEIIKRTVGHPKPTNSIHMRVAWMRKRLQEGTLTDPQKIKLIDMMESGDKARFHILKMLLEVAENSKSPTMSLAVSRELLNWAKLQYGERHINLNIEAKTSVDEMLKMLEEHDDKGAGGEVEKDTE